MKIMLTILLGMLTTTFFGCKKKSNEFLLKGKIDGKYNGYIFLKYNEVLDSSLVESNSFIFKGSTPNPTMGLLFPGRPSSTDEMTLGNVMLENTSIEVYLKYSESNTNLGWTKLLDVDSIIGSKSQDLRNRFENKMTATVYNEKIDSVKEASLYDNLHEFISNNPRSVMSGEYLGGLSSYYNYLNGDQIENLLKIMDTTYQDKGDLEKIRALIRQSKIFEIGNEPPNITLPDQEGKIVNRLAFNGKVVLLEFWASWCVPCRQTNPELLDIYDSFKTGGFEILGISIDRNKQDWQTAIRKDSLSWPQVIDSLKTTETTYNLNSIPFNLLLDREGKIMAQNVKPVDLRNILVKEL